MANIVSQKATEMIPRRAILFLFVLFACMFSYVIRVLAIGIMYTERNDDHRNDSLLDANNSENHETKYVTLGQEQIYAATAFSFGAMMSSIPAGVIAEKYGGSKVVARALLICSLLNLLVPWFNLLPSVIVLLLRFTIGSCVGAIYPALNAIIARWVPPDEKGMFMWTLQSGSFGACVTFFFYTNVIPYYHWRAACWTGSLITLVFYWLWKYSIYDCPEIHPSITSVEIEFIKKKIGSSVSNQKSSFPVKTLLTSMPFFVLLYAHLANTWGAYFIPTSLEYRWKMLNISAETLGALTMLLHVPVLLVGQLFAVVGDFWRRKNTLKVKTIRRIFITLSHFIPTFCLMLTAPYTSCNQLPNLSLTALVLFFNSAACQSSLQNHHDLAPNYAGYLFGIMNAVSNFFELIILMVVSDFTNDSDGIHEWCNIMRILAFTYLSSMTLFWIWGSTKIQRWNNPNYPSTEDVHFAKELGCELGVYNSVYCIEDK